MRFLVAILVCAASLTTSAQSTSRIDTLPDAPDAHLAATKTGDSMQSATKADSEEAAAITADLIATGPTAASRKAASPKEASPKEASLDMASLDRPGLDTDAFSSSILIAAFQSGEANQNTTTADKQASSQTKSSATAPSDEEQPKRILGLMPNYRAVSAGVRPPPPSAKESFIIATENNFDYSQFVFVGLTSLMAEGTNTHTEFGKGARGYWSYYWRGYIDKSDGDYLIIFAFPTLFHEDERYFAMGQGGFWKRVEYSGMSVFITPNYHGKNTFNWAEILGRGVSQAVSLTYYPSEVATPSSYFSKFGYAVGRDALTNVFREFYPDIARTVFKPFHRKKTQKDS